MPCTSDVRGGDGDERVVLTSALSGSALVPCTSDVRGGDDDERVVLTSALPGSALVPCINANSSNGCFRAGDSAVLCGVKSGDVSGGRLLLLEPEVVKASRAALDVDVMPPDMGAMTSGDGRLSGS